MRWSATERTDSWKKLKSILLEREFEMSEYLLTNPHKILTRLVAANIGFDIIAVAFWTAFPARLALHYACFSCIETCSPATSSLALG